MLAQALSKPLQRMSSLSNASLISLNDNTTVSELCPGSWLQLSVGTGRPNVSQCRSDPYRTARFGNRGTSRRVFFFRGVQKRIESVSVSSNTKASTGEVWNHCTGISLTDSGRAHHKSGLSQVSSYDGFRPLLSQTILTKWIFMTWLLCPANVTIFYWQCTPT